MAELFPFEKVLAMLVFGWWVLCPKNSSAAAATAPSQYNSRLWEMDDGLPQNFVQAIAQTRDGYLWVGTQNGLAQFDGVHFTIYNVANTPELKHANITGLHACKDGTLWIATGHGGMCHLKNGAFAHYGKGDGLAGDQGIGTILDTEDGSVWMATAEGLSKFKDGSFSTLTRSNGLASSIVVQICEDRKHRLWLGTANGVDCLEGGAVTGHMNLEGYGTEIKTIYYDHEDALWIGVGTNLVCYRDGAITNYARKEGSVHNFVTSIYEDRQKNLWIGSANGLSRFVEGNFLPELNSDGLPYDRINTIMEDQEGNIWVGTKDGLSRLKIKRFTSYTRQEGLTHRNVMSVLQDQAGTMWISTWGGGLNQIKNGAILPYTSDRSLTAILALGMLEDRQGRLWVGTDFDGGLFRLDGNEVQHFTSENGLPKAAVRVIFEDSRTNLWVGTSGGLYQIKENHFVRVEPPCPPDKDIIRSIYEDRSSDLWVGKNNGLMRFHCGQWSEFKGADSLSSNAVISFHEDAEGSLWIGTGGGGLNRLKNGKLSTYTTREGLFNDTICEILEDRHSWLWMGCPRGVFRANRKNLDDFDGGKTSVINCISYGKADGMVGETCNSVAEPSGWKSRDGRLWFATTKGLCVIDPDTATNMNTAPLPVVIEQVVADKHAFRASPGTSLKSPLRVPPGRGDFEFHYTALSFRVPEKNSFKYKLEGLDSDWIDAGPRRIAYYYNVRPGSYRFHIMACNNDGIHNEPDSAGSTLALTFLPYWWQTWWFKALIGVICLCLCAGTIRYATGRKLHRKLELLERQNVVAQERSRIAQDMHDDLGARLTGIMLLSDMIEHDHYEGPAVNGHLQKITRSCRELVQDLDSMVWAVDPGNDSLENTAVYIYEYVERFLAESSIRCRLEAPDNLPSFFLSSEVRHHLFLVVKEALNNAVKHGLTSEINVSLSFDDSILRLTVADNGKGFLIREKSAQGNGLANMEMRVNKIGGQFHCSSQPDKGTRISLIIPLKNAQA